MLFIVLAQSFFLEPAKAALARKLELFYQNAKLPCSKTSSPMCSSH